MTTAWVETMWAIAGHWTNGRGFLYCGTWLTRQDAIAAHTTAKGQSWRLCRKYGDRAVKVEIQWEATR